MSPSLERFGLRVMSGEARGVGPTLLRGALDWDRAAMGDRARDLAHFAATLWAGDVVRGRPPSWSSLTTLVNAYARRCEPPDAVTLELAAMFGELGRLAGTGS